MILAALILFSIGWYLFEYDPQFTRDVLLRQAQKLEENGCPKVVVHDLARCDMALAVADAFRYSKLVLATTTYNADIFPFMREFIHHLTERNFANHKIGLTENGSRAPMAAKIYGNTAFITVFRGGAPV